MELTVFSVLCLSSSGLAKEEARMGAWNRERQTDVLGMVYARQRATDQNALCSGESNRNVNGFVGEGGPEESKPL